MVSGKRLEGTLPLYLLTQCLHCLQTARNSTDNVQHSCPATESISQAWISNIKWTNQRWLLMSRDRFRSWGAILLTQSTHFLMDSLGDFQCKPIILQFYFVGLIRRLRICSLLCQGDLTILNIDKMLEGSMKCCKTSSLRECTREIWLNLIWLSPVNKMLAAKSPHILALELQGRHESPIFTNVKILIETFHKSQVNKTLPNLALDYGKVRQNDNWYAMINGVIFHCFVLLLL